MKSKEKYADYHLSDVYRFCNFAETTIEGVYFFAESEPLVIGDRRDGNVVFPASWTTEQRMIWRAKESLLS